MEITRYQDLFNSIEKPPGGVFIIGRTRSKILLQLPEYKESKDNQGEYKFLNPEEYRLRLERLQKEFPNVVIDMDKYDGVDQENEGACSFCAFLNMIHLTKNDSLFNISKRSKKSKKSKKVLKSFDVWTTVKRSWKTLWKNTKCEAQTSGGTICAAKSIAHVLDNVLTHNIVKDFTKMIKYVPIRDFSDKYYNARFKGDTFDDVVRNIQQYIEGTLDRGIPMMINYGEHTRVAIGYNKERLLFADSWAKLYSEKSKDGTDINEAGFSHVNKWMIYSFCRDTAYFEDEDEEDSVGIAKLKL